MRMSVHEGGPGEGRYDVLVGIQGVNPEDGRHRECKP